MGYILKHYYWLEEGLNDSMARHVATEWLKLMMRKDLKVIDSKCWFLDLLLRKTSWCEKLPRLIDIYNELNSFDIDID